MNLRGTLLLGLSGASAVFAAGLAVHLIMDRPLKSEDSWQITSKDVSVIRHLSGDCLKIFRGTYLQTGDKNNGWTIRCDYSRNWRMK